MAGTVYGPKHGLSLSESWDAAKVRTNREHEITYVVVMDSETDDEADVDLVSGVPQIGDLSGVVAGALCIAREFNEVGPKVWEVTATYSTSYSGDPTDIDPLKWAWSFETIDEPLLWDAVNGGAIKNSAWEPLPPINTPIAVPVLTIKRYETFFSGSTLLAYVNKVNSDAFWGAAAGQCLCAGITADQISVDGEDLWEVTYTFKFKMDSYGWKARILDQGSYFWSGTVGSSTKTAFETDDGKPTIGNLDGSGGENTTSTPYFVTYNRYAATAFGPLALS